MTKVEVIKEHIKLREIFWEYRYSPLQYAYGFVRCLMHSRATLEGANRGLHRLIADFGTASKLNTTFARKH
jgi:hypothetical protein